MRAVCPSMPGAMLEALRRAGSFAPIVPVDERAHRVDERRARLVALGQGRFCDAPRAPPESGASECPMDQRGLRNETWLPVGGRSDFWPPLS